MNKECNPSLDPIDWRGRNKKKDIYQITMTISLEHLHLQHLKWIEHLTHMEYNNIIKALVFRILNKTYET